MKKNFDDKTFLSNGYIRSEWTDRNDPKGTFDDMKFVEFTKAISTDFKIEVTFYYSAEKEGKFDTLKETTCELNAGGGSYFLKLEQNIETLESVYKLLTNKKIK